MTMTNITIKIDSDLALSAKVLAARNGTSLSRLVADQIRSLVSQDQTWLAAQQNALRQLKLGFDLEWEGTESRDEIHQREMLR